MNDIISFEDTEYIKTIEIKKNDEIDIRTRILDQLESKINEIELKSMSEFVISTDLNKQIKDIISKIEKQKLKLTKSMRDKVSEINASFKEISERALKMKIILEDKIIQYNKKLQAEAQKIAEIEKKKEIEDLEKKKKIAKMQASFLEDEKGIDERIMENCFSEDNEKIMESYDNAIEAKKETPIEIKSSFNTGKTQTNIRSTWTYEIIDPVKIPIEFCIPDPRKIRIAIDIGARNIPGLRIYQKERVSSRKAK